MSKFSPFSFLKRQAKAVAKQQNMPLSSAQELVAQTAGFSHFHEMQKVALRYPSDKRLLKAAFGVESYCDSVFGYAAFSALELYMEDQLASEIAETNAEMFMVENLEPVLISYNPLNGILSLRLVFEYTGEQIPDKIYHGTTFFVEAEAELRWRNGEWILCRGGLSISSFERDIDRFYAQDGNYFDQETLEEFDQDHGEDTAVEQMISESLRSKL